MTTRRGVIVGRILVIPLLLLAMEGVVAAGVFNELFVAPPSSFIPALGRNLVSGDLLPLTWITIRR
jgi:ABC-type nitrate/sulfonate/bicarbonate transport system permease component